MSSDVANITQERMDKSLERVFICFLGCLGRPPKQPNTPPFEFLMKRVNQESLCYMQFEIKILRDKNEAAGFRQPHV